MDLPPEIRVMVYELVLPRGQLYEQQHSEKPSYNTYTRANDAAPALLKVSKLVHAESTPLFYASNRFELYATVRYSKKLGAIARVQRLTGVNLAALQDDSRYKWMVHFEVHVGLTWECKVCSPSVGLSMEVKDGVLSNILVEAPWHAWHECEQSIPAPVAKQLTELYDALSATLKEGRAGFQVEELIVV